MPNSILPAAFIYGLTIGATTLSLGPVNLMILREGLAAGRVLLTATCAWTSYWLLLGLAYLLAEASPVADATMRTALTRASVVALVVLSILSTRSGLRGLRLAGGSDALTRHGIRSRYMLAVIWCSPLTYVELVLVPAGLCRTGVAAGSGFPFIAGYAIMAALVCLFYGYAGRLMAPLVTPRASSLFDLASGLVLAGLAVSLLRSCLG